MPGSAHAEVLEVLVKYGGLAAQAESCPWQEVYYEQGVQLWVSPDGSVRRDAVSSTEGPKAASPGSGLDLIDLSIDDTMACAIFEGPTSSVSLSLLRAGGSWRVIAELVCADRGRAAFAADDFAAVCGGAQTYLSTNRAGDAAGMATVFDEVSRLTFSTGAELAVFSQTEFCDMVRTRWATPKHAPYAHLKDDPRLAARDSIFFVKFLAPNAAVVKLAVGFPPVLYTDLLFFAHTAGSWKIVAKSSVNLPFLAAEAAQ